MKKEDENIAVILDLIEINKISIISLNDITFKIVSIQTNNHST